MSELSLTENIKTPDECTVEVKRHYFLHYTYARNKELVDYNT
jgi:hypothetical protein